MFTTSSRYFELTNKNFTTASGKTIVYKQRRFLPQAETMQQVAEVTITENNRFDNIATQTLGDPSLYWQIADANNAMNPSVLTNEIGGKLRITDSDLMEALQ